jgi:hypothetical protein
LFDVCHFSSLQARRRKRRPGGLVEGRLQAVILSTRERFEKWLFRSTPLREGRLRPLPDRKLGVRFRERSIWQSNGSKMGFNENEKQERKIALSALFTVSRVPWIGRPSIRVDVGRPAALVEIALMSVVAGCAKALQIAVEELIPIPSMRHDVIRDRRHCGNAVCCAHRAKRLIAQLTTPTPTPSFERVPIAPIERDRRRRRRVYDSSRNSK